MAHPHRTLSVLGGPSAGRVSRESLVRISAMLSVHVDPDCAALSDDAAPAVRPRAIKLGQLYLAATTLSRAE